ncbi:MAG: hypothetical protein ACRD2A_23420 [Vicinamibacterales bacterium]
MARLTGLAVAVTSLWWISGASAQVRQPVTNCTGQSDLIVGQVGAPSCSVSFVCDVELPLTQCQADGEIELRGHGLYTATGMLEIDGVPQQTNTWGPVPSPLFIESVFGTSSAYAPAGSTITVTCEVTGLVAVDTSLRCGLYADPN